MQELWIEVRVLSNILKCGEYILYDFGWVLINLQTAPPGLSEISIGVIRRSVRPNATDSDLKSNLSSIKLAIRLRWFLQNFLEFFLITVNIIEWWHGYNAFRACTSDERRLEGESKLSHVRLYFWCRWSSGIISRAWYSTWVSKYYLCSEYFMLYLEANS